MRERERVEKLSILTDEREIILTDDRMSSSSEESSSSSDDNDSKMLQSTDIETALSNFLVAYVKFH